MKRILKENETIKEAIKLLKRTDKARNAFVLILDADNGEIIHLWKGLCSHEIQELCEEVVSMIEKHDLKEEKRQALKELKKMQKVKPIKPLN